MAKKEKNMYLFFLVLGLTGIYGFSDMKHMFYDILKSALRLSDLQLSQIWGSFGAAAMVSYLGGGFLTDRIAPSKLISAALTLSGLLHLLMSFVPDMTAGAFPVSLLLSAGMGLCAVLLFFPASSKILTLMSEENSGGILGKYYGFAGLLTALVDLTATMLYADTKNELLLFQIILRFFAALNIGVGVSVGVRFWKKRLDFQSGNVVCLKEIPSVLRQKKIWLIAAVILCNYIVCCLSSYYTPYLTEIFGIAEENALLIGTLRLGILCLVSGLLWGKWVDKMKSAKRVIGVSFVILFLVLGGLSVYSILTHYNNKAPYILAGTVLLTFAVVFVSLGIKSVSLALVSELHVPARTLGTVIGVVSFVGYSPDAFFYPAAGHILQNCGAYAYSILFLTGAAAAVLGFLCITELQKGAE